MNTPLVVHSFYRFEHYQQEVIRRCVEVMSSGMSKFQQIKSSNGLPTLQDTTTYCYFVAGCVGEMLTDLFCEYSPEISTRRDKLFPLASCFGRGLQMTNILKDMWEDRSHGVCWLPRDIFDQAGFSLSHLGSGTYKPAFGLALARLIGITRFYLKKGLDYSLHLPVSESGIRKFCLWSIGMAIFTLRNINRNPDFSSAVEVKISRTTVKTIMAVSRATIRSNFMLQFLFTVFAWGLPSANSGRRLLRTGFSQGSGEPIGRCALE